MLPTPIISTETLVSCAEATQIEAPKTIDANRDGFIIHQILSPKRQKPAVALKSSDRVVYRNAATDDADRFRSTIKGSVNVDSLQHHSKSGRSVTNEGGISLSPMRGPTAIVR
jgi:hypothetical protein